MKKLISLALVLCMACMLVPAMAEEDVTGEWYGGMMGQPLTMIFTADGNVGMFLAGNQISEGTWTQEGATVTITEGEDSPYTMELSDGALIYAEMDVRLTRNPEDLPATVQVADIKAAESAEEFYGEWTSRYVENEGMIIDLSNSEQTFPGLKLAEGTVEFIATSEDDAMAAMYNMLALSGTFADGKLNLTSVLSPDATCIAEMLEDGMLKLTMVGDDGLSVYFVPATAAEAPAA